MKKLGILFITLCSLTLLLYALLQSNLGKTMVRKTIESAVSDAGLNIQIDRIDGTLPHQIDLKGVTINNEVKIQQLSLRPVLWRLFSKELAFNNVHAKEISIQGGTPFDFDGKFRINKKRAVAQGIIDGWSLYAKLDISDRSARFKFENPFLNGKGTALFDPQFQLQSSHIQLGSDQLLSKLPFSASGFLLANLLIQKEEGAYKGRIQWKIPNLKVEKVRVGAIKGKGEAVWANGNLKGEMSAEPFAKGTFDLQITSNQLVIGTTEIFIGNLQSLHIPRAYGKLDLKGEWKEIDQVQALSLNGEAADFYYGSFFAQKATLYADLLNPFHQLSGNFDLEVEKGKWRDLTLESASFETNREEKNWSYRLFAEGKWNHPLQVHMNGTWQDHFKAHVENLSGTFYNHPFVLAKSVEFEWNPDQFHLPDVEIEIGDATAYFDIERKGDDSDIRLRFDRLPLDFLSLNPLDVRVNGQITLQAEIHEKKNRLEGTLKGAIDQMEVATIAMNDRIRASGAIEGTFDRDLLKLKGNLSVSNNPLFSLDLSLPIHFSLWPFEAKLLTHKEARGELLLDGRMEEILDFFNLGPHRFEGETHCRLRFTNTLYRPLVEGTIQIKEGFYQNYYTGTELRHIQADFLAEKNQIFLRSLTAEDAPGTGRLSANGEIELLQSDLYPFNLDLDIQNLQFVEIDLVTAAAAGKVHLEGNALSAVAKGEIEIIQSQFAIPDHIPRPLPNLEVVYRNPIHPTPPPQTEYHPYPLYLDLHVRAPSAVTISGRGLTSEWKGDFHLGGTYTSLAAKGKLELISGEFNFSTRSFKLTDGSLTLSGVEHEMPYLNLAATTETKGITITARLKGPLDDPQVTLQSIPALPLGSIMSYLLFGQDISEIGGFQALELATSLASLAGSGPDVMESTRRSLGVDRLRVITDPTEEGGETVALQVGKYVSKGVLVSFTQGVDESSTNISVEVELKGNFVFQIESDQHQEQGKFTLKWNLNY